MGNILDYITWRSDLSFNENPFNHIDSLILCQLLYLDIDQIVSNKFTTSITLENIKEHYLRLNLDKNKNGIFINKNTNELLLKASQSKRFKDVQFFGFTNIINYETESQFAAVCALLPTNQLCVVFRGTDDTLIGWKEDFNMTFTFPVPAQELAVEYLENACKKRRKSIFVMGHSKGGNLSVYASSFCSSNTRKKITTIFDNDGPGFLPDALKTKGYNEAIKKTITIIPEASPVGILLKRSYAPTFISSSASIGIAQHDMFTWKIECTDFLTCERESTLSVITSKSVHKWLDEVSINDRKKFIIDLFNVLKATNATTLNELTSDWIKSSVIVVKAMGELDKKTKEQISSILKILFNVIEITIPSFKEFLGYEKK